MKKLLFPAIPAIFLLLFALAAATPAAAQKAETVDGVRIVHNVRGGLWGPAPKVGLELVRKIGEMHILGVDRFNRRHFAQTRQ